MASFKRISQETFDNAVRENVEDFEMEFSDALRDAIDQFQKQGVDLSSIDTTGGIGREEVDQMIESLIKYRDGDASLDILDILAQLRLLCDEKHELGLRNQNLLLNKGGFNALHDLVLENLTNDILEGVFNTLLQLCRTNGKLNFNRISFFL